MFTENILSQTGSHNVVDQRGCFNVVEYTKDYSVTHDTAASRYFAAQMNLRKRQVVAALNGNAITIQSRAMQMLIGQVDAATNVKGAGDLMKKFIGGRVTGESADSPPIRDSVLLSWNRLTVYPFRERRRLGRRNGHRRRPFPRLRQLGSARRYCPFEHLLAVMGNEGLFNSILKGSGIAVLESRVPAEGCSWSIQQRRARIDGNMRSPGPARLNSR